ncbi:MAG: 50S ribosomal protein L13 [bacterium]|nr:50S ribosomal protein L13 [bacterium]
MEREIHTIDATNKVPGRLATEIAVLLMGKHKPSYQTYTDCGDEVIIENVKHLKVSKKFAENKIYYNHSLYPGGLKKTKAKDMTKEKILHTAVYNMLPKNKIRSEMIKRLKIT